MGIGILRSAYARSDFWVKEYARFSQDELAKDVNLSAFEMMKRWLKVRPYSVQAFTNQCLKKIEFAEKCLPQKQNAKAYDNNPCAGLGAGEKIER